MGTIQPGSDDGCDEELRAVSVLPGVRHRQQTGLAVLVREVLICVREQGSVTDIEKKKKKKNDHDDVPANFSP